MSEAFPRIASESQPEPDSEPVSPEPDVSPELKKVSDDVQGLLREDTADSVFTAAQQLAKLKVAGTNLAARHEPPLFEQLRKHQTAIEADNPDHGGKYEGYLKYLGAVEGMTDEERQQVEKEFGVTVGDMQPESPLGSVEPAAEAEWTAADEAELREAIPEAEPPRSAIEAAKPEAESEPAVAASETATVSEPEKSKPEEVTTPPTPEEIAITKRQTELEQEVTALKATLVGSSEKDKKRGKKVKKLKKMIEKLEKQIENLKKQKSNKDNKKKSIVKSMIEGGVKGAKESGRFNKWLRNWGGVFK